MSPHPLGPAVLLRGVRRVPVGTVRAATRTGRRALDRPVDLRIGAGRVLEVAERLEPRGDDEVIDADGRWAIPGLWDHHVHLGQWSHALTRVNLVGTHAPHEVLDRVAAHIESTEVAAGLEHPATDDRTAIVGYGFRPALWEHEPTVAELDRVADGRAVVLISGDAHTGWLSSAALELLGLPGRTGALVESEWFSALARWEGLQRHEDSAAGEFAAYQLALAAAAAHGVVGAVDLEFELGQRYWPDRVAMGLDQLRVRIATYPDGLDEVLEAGWRTGDLLPGGRGLLTMGPLKIISDGSLNSRTAYSRQPYPGHGAAERGMQNYSPTELQDLLSRATAAGLEVAVHTIGDAALADVLDAVEATGARGSVEHVQLALPEDLVRMARLEVIASVQPAHLLDDRDVTDRLWPDRTQHSFPLRGMIDAGVRMALGSDAPVAPLDPWLAMHVAVHRTDGERPAWHPEQAITMGQALAASTDDQGTLRLGSRADIALLDADPLTAADVRDMPVAATLVGGRTTHRTF